MTTENEAAPDSATQNEEKAPGRFQSNEEKAAYAKRDAAVKRANEAELKSAALEEAASQTSAYKDKLEQFERERAEADGDLKKQLELIQAKQTETEQRAVDAEKRLLSSGQMGRERDVLDELAKKFPDASRSVIRGLYLGLAEDQKIERYSADEGHVEAVAVLLTDSLAGSGRPNPEINGGSRIPAGFSSDTKPGKPQSLAQAIDGIKQETGRKYI